MDPNEFDRFGWPPSISMPKEMRGERLHQTLQSLNKDLKMLRFRANSGTDIS